MHETDNLKLRLTAADETSMTFFEWRTLMNGVNGADDLSNMQKLDKAINELNADIGGRADGFKFDPETGELKLTSGGSPLPGASVMINLDWLYTKDEVDKKISDAVDVVERSSVAAVEWSEEKRQLQLLNSDGDPIGDPITITGGGSGGSGGGQNNATISVTNTSGWTMKTIAHGDACVVRLNWSSTENGMETGDGSLRIFVSGSLKKIINVSQGNVEADVSPYLAQGENKLALTVEDIYGNSRTVRMTVTTVALSIRSSLDTTTPFTGAISFPYVPTGSNGEKTVYFIVDGVEAGRATVKTNGRPQTYTIPQQRHGPHSILVYFEEEINGQTVRSNELYYEVVCVSQTDNTPVITSTFTKTREDQFNTINIGYSVYSPATTHTSIAIKVNGEVKSRLSVDRTPQVFSWFADEAGTLVVELEAGTPGGDDYASKRWTIEIRSTDMDIGAEETGLALYLNARGRSNGEANREEWSYQDITSTLSGFNWRINGWMQDDNGMDVLRLCDDARVVIHHKPFASNFISGGKTIEIEFATRDVADYNAVIMSCFSGGRGIVVTPQNVVFSGAQTNISTLYKDNEHIRLTITIGKQNDYRLILMYINGIMSRAIQYAAGESFNQLSPVDITIGSSVCGIDIYNIRVYDHDLSRNGVLRNWIADTQDGIEMRDRYVRNDVYSANEEITINTLPPNLPYMVIKAAELPQYKGDKKTVEGYYTDPVDNTKSFSYTGCQINVQGTSSAPYYRKNYDMQFKKGFVAPDGTGYDMYGLKTNSIPFNRFVLKADVASSESTNNTGLTSFYSDTCPYKTPEQKENPRVRQGIEGVPIVLFWEDEASGDVKFMGKYNFNLPKRAPEPLGFSGNMESWEWQRNNSANVKFQDDDFETMVYDAKNDEWYPSWYDDFEARFPEDTWRDTNQLKEFLSWVKSTYRDAATNASLVAPVTFRLKGTSTVDMYPDDSSYSVVNEVQNGTDTGYRLITFNKDTPAYRLSKFKAEAGDYVELESAIYYYLFTETFLMIDSRAKNMFPSFNGGPVDKPGRQMSRKVVFMPYDMDTALGTNNSGVLMFGYSLNDTDHVSSIISGDGSGGSNAPVFNAQDSAFWTNLRDAFKGEIATMYTNLRANKVWSYEILKEMYETHQSKWCEAIFNEDAWTKYIVPLTDPVTIDDDTGLPIRTDRYLTMLQGSKAEQRKWWLYNRFRYKDSQYVTGDAASKIINMRLFNSGTMKLTPAIDMYVGVSFGGGTTPSLKRANANEEVSFTYQAGSGVTEMETWIYSADMIADVGDLSVFYPNELDFSKATKLRQLKIGSAAAGYSNANLVTLDVSNCRLLEMIDCRNCPRLNITVDLSGSPRLKEAYFDNTAITGVELVDGAAIETLHLPASITTLALMNLNKLSDLVIPDYSNVTKLILSNMDQNIIDPVAVIRQMAPNSSVYIDGLDLEYNTAAEIGELYDLLDTMKGVTREKNENGEWMYHDHDKAQVSGTIRIGSLTGEEIAAFNERYPYIRIVVENMTRVIYYYNDDGTQLIYTELVPDGGECGIYTGIPTKEPSQMYTYAFAGWSRRMNQEAGDANAFQDIDSYRRVYAAFSKTLRNYTIRFYHGDTLLYTAENVPYGTNAAYVGETPERLDSSGWEFDRWEPSCEGITGDTSCYAQFRDVASLTVRYLSYDGDTHYSDAPIACGAGAYMDHYELKTVIAAFTSIGVQAFYNAANLESVELTGAALESIGNNAFYGCNELKEVIISSRVVPALDSVRQFPYQFYDNGTGVIYVPDDMLEAYMNDSSWNVTNEHILPISKRPDNDVSTIADSWATIFASERNGDYAMRYHIGDTKALQIGDERVYMQIAAFDEDNLADGSGKAKITWICKGLWRGVKHNLGPAATVWRDMAIRAELNDDMYNAIQADVREKIQTVTKRTTGVESGVSQVIETDDKLWIPSHGEVFATAVYEGSDVAYDGLFANNASRIRYDNTVAAAQWALRSSVANDRVTVTATGAYVFTSISDKHYTFGFCT